MSNELKPCPFCGNSGLELISIDYPLAGSGTHLISCCIEMRRSYLLDGYCRKNSVDSKVKTSKALIDNWNRRIYDIK